MSSSRIVSVITQIMVMAVVISVVLLFIGIGILVLIHLCIVGRAFRRGLSNRRSGERSSNHRGNGNGNGNSGMSQADVQKLPSFEYKLGGMSLQVGSGADQINIIKSKNNNILVSEFDFSECAVCLDGFQRGEKCRMLPICKHCFHAKCVDAWLYKSPVCPICRTSAEQHGGKVALQDGLESTRVRTCELVTVPQDFAIGIPVQGRGDSIYHNSEMPNLMSTPPPPSRSPDAFVCNLRPTPLRPRSPDDVRVISVSSPNQNQNQNQCQNQTQDIGG
eukprot:Gb_20807 [translate_table: standard]